MATLTTILTWIGFYIIGAVAVPVVIGLAILWAKYIERTEFEISTIEIGILSLFSWIGVFILSACCIFYVVCFLSYKFCLKYVFRWLKRFSKWFSNLQIWNKQIVLDKEGKLKITE